jgi:hypothetical protein
MNVIDFTDPANDSFGLPEISIPVQCIHCDEEYDSYRIEWRIETDADGKPHGFWCCPIEGCSGMGFGFDIFPVRTGDFSSSMMTKRIGKKRMRSGKRMMGNK